jgi:hypothetical protein
LTAANSKRDRLWGPGSSFQAGELPDVEAAEEPATEQPQPTAAARTSWCKTRPSGHEPPAALTAAHAQADPNLAALYLWERMHATAFSDIDQLMAREQQRAAVLIAQINADATTRIEAERARCALVLSETRDHFAAVDAARQALEQQKHELFMGQLALTQQRLAQAPALAGVPELAQLRARVDQLEDELDEDDGNGAEKTVPSGKLAEMLAILHEVGEWRPIVEAALKRATEPDAPKAPSSPRSRVRGSVGE